MSDNNDNNPKNLNYLTFGYSFLGGMIFFVGIGYFIDKKIGDSQIWTLVGIFLGLVYGGYEIWKIIREGS